MARLLIQFASAEIAEFRWAKIDEDDYTADISWQLAGEEELSKIAAQHPHPLIMIIPQQCVYLTQVELPERAGRQILSAIEYQIEDQLACDIETQHFALGDSNENPVSIAVVDRSIMQRCIALARGHGLRLTQIVPELFLSPWPGSGIVLTPGFDGYLLRYGVYRGQKCSEQTLPAMLDLIRREIEFDSVTCFTSETESAPEIENYSVEQRSLSEVRSGFVNDPIIDLQQRDFQMSSAWRGMANTWKWIALLLAGLLVIGVYNKAVALQTLEQELAAIKQQQYELLKPHLSADIGPEDNLKRALIDRLQQLQTNQAEQGFLQLLQEFTRARDRFPEVEITRIGYQGKQLIFDISSAQLTKIETLLEAVKKQGIDATLVSLNIKPEKSSGRLILGGGDDV
jgi:general secretion pathway protein L